MKSVKLFSLFVATAFSFATVKAQTADEIVSKHIEAMGGADKLRTIKTVVTEGTLNVQGIEIILKTSSKHNYGRRIDLNAMGMENYEIVRIDSGWRYFPIMQQSSVDVITSDELKQSQRELDQQSDLLDYKLKGHSVEYLGKEDVDGTNYYKLKINYKWGASATYFIDPATYYIMQSKNMGMVNGQEVEVVIKMFNYKKTEDGFIFPFTLELPQGSMSVTKIEINKDLSDSIFTVSK